MAKKNEQATVNEVEVNEQENEQATVTEVEPAKPKKPAKVKIKLPITRSEKDDVVVVLNGKSYLIKRGFEVEVPYGVAKILERKEKMLQIALAYEEAAAQGLDGIDKN